MKLNLLVGAVVLALLFIVNLLVTAPARLLGMVVPGEQIVLRGLTGTLWDGSASSVMLRLPQGYFQLGAVDWSLHPMSLLTLSPHLSLSSRWGDQTLAGDVILRSPQDLDLLNLEARMEAGLLGRFAPVAVEGVFSLQAQSLQLRDGLPYSGQGRVVWQSASWKSPRGLVPFGSYALNFEQPEGEALKGEVITLAGPLQAKGSVQLAQRHYAVNIALSSEQPLDAQVTQMLSLMAQPQNGGFHLTVEGDL